MKLGQKFTRVEKRREEGGGKGEILALGMEMKGRRGAVGESLVGGTGGVNVELGAGVEVDNRFLWRRKGMGERGNGRQ